MANVNGNNMDDLFRQASDQYPLRTDSSDWNRLTGALEANPSLASPKGSEQDNKRRRRRVLLLLMPLLAGGLGYYAWQTPAARKGLAATVQPVVAAGQTNNTGLENSAIGQFSNTNAKAMPAAKTDGEVSAGTAVANGDNARDRGNGNGVSGNEATGNRTIRNGVTGNEVTGDRIPHTGVNGNEGSAGVDPTVKGVTAPGEPDVFAGSADAVTGGGNIGAGGNGTPADLQYSKVNGLWPMAKGDIAVTADVRAKANGNSGQPAQKVAPSSHRHAIYVGLLGAPDLSTIEFQSVRSMGTTFGILGGYTLNKKWSLETGVYLDKKEYYTTGRYFNTEKIPVLQSSYVNLKGVNGSCNMVEIPINLRYNISSGPHRTLFATTGLNTYLMYQEQYQYQILWNGTPQTSAPFTYKNPYHYLFSIIDMSIGYEQKLGKIGNLRIEPYLRIPLSGIGTGDLSILSAGLNLGITRRIW
jgi:hypothetical protein